MKIISGALLAGAIACGSLVPVSAAQAASEKVLYNFCSQTNCTDGINPSSGVVLVKGMLYGATSGGGVGTCNNISACGEVYALNPRTGAQTILHSFNGVTDGIYPTGNLIAVKNTLYGATEEGGQRGLGMVFALDTQTGAETALYSFAGGKDGAYPEGGLTAIGPNFYGVTGIGGGFGCPTQGCGTVFVLNKKTGAETVLHAFRGGADDGAKPNAGLAEVNGMLYGTTNAGGGRQNKCFDMCGTMFAIDPKTGAETVLHVFNGVEGDGRNPGAGPIAVNGMLYGTTTAGGANQGGTIFSLDPQTGAETVLYSFCPEQNCLDGDGPIAGLIEADGVLYGTTSAGGTANRGTVFAFNLQTGVETALHSFCTGCTDGQQPRTGLFYTKSKLYGTTYYGGTHGGGVVFSVAH